MPCLRRPRAWPWPWPWPRPAHRLPPPATARHLHPSPAAALSPQPAAPALTRTRPAHLARPPAFALCRRYKELSEREGAKAAQLRELLLELQRSLEAVQRDKDAALAKEHEARLAAEGLAETYRAKAEQLRAAQGAAGAAPCACAPACLPASAAPPARGGGG